MPAGQRSEGQQWIAASMRLLSLTARAGGSIAKALADLRQVVWEKGPVRCGFFVKEDGTQVPIYHDSEVAAIAFMLQRMLMRRGFLDAAANQVPTAVLARLYAVRQVDAVLAEVPAAANLDSPTTAPAAVGNKCPECGARALHKVDGCQRCNECHYIGSCG
jgi:ribonucleoside-diphosphate reductase alpha chain